MKKNLTYFVRQEEIQIKGEERKIQNDRVLLEQLRLSFPYVSFPSPPHEHVACAASPVTLDSLTVGLFHQLSKLLCCSHAHTHTLQPCVGSHC